MDNNSAPPEPPVINNTPFPPIDEGGAPILGTSPSEIISKPPSSGMGWKRTVATVLGLVLLIGATGATALVIKNMNNNQDIRNRAAGCACSPDDESVCIGDWFHPSCNPSFTCAGTKKCADENTPTPKATSAPKCKSTDKCCPPDEKCQEDASGNNTGYNCTCVAVAGNTYDWRCTDFNTDKCDNGGSPPPAGSFKCDSNAPTGMTASGNCITYSQAVPMTRYTCPEGTDMTNGCSENPETSTTKQLCADRPSSNWCGTVQVDYGQHPAGCSISRKFTCASSSPTTKPTSTPPSSATPPMCQSVKAYDSSWTQLTAAQLSQLKSGNQIHFAVDFNNGNSGNIDKAQFTINGVAGAEVTTKHGSLFYVDYTIPAGTLNFSVSAKLHSTVFGWF
jgi:hypothetical protein